VVVRAHVSNGIVGTIYDVRADHTRLWQEDVCHLIRCEHLSKIGRARQIYAQQRQHTRYVNFRHGSQHEVRLLAR